MKILLSSYSFGAGKGSEPGVGWNIASGLARRGHEITVVTTTEYAEQNHKALENEQLPIRLLEWDEGLSDFAKRETYNLWQKKIGNRLNDVARNGDFNLVHHITFNQYRGIYDVFAANLPFLIGPIGGAEVVPYAFLTGKHLPPAMTMKEILRHCPWDAQALISRFNNSGQRGLILASNKPTAQRLNRNFPFSLARKARVCPIIAVHGSEILDEPPVRADHPYFVYYGGMRPEKGASLLFPALRRIWDEGVCIPVMMSGMRDEDLPLLRQTVSFFGLPQEAVKPLEFMPRTQLLEIMRGAVAFISTSLRDSGCMALLESVAQGVPSVCFDIPSQDWLLPEFAQKVSMSPRGGKIRAEFCIEGLKNALLKAASSAQPDSEWHRNRASWLRQTMTWEVRLTQIEEAYQHILSPS